MESVFVKNMPEATVNRTNQKKQKKQKKQNPEGNVSARVSSEFPQGFVFFVFFCFFFVFFCFFFVVSCFFVFFVFLLNCAKSFLVELWADKRMQKVDLGGGEHIYIYMYIYTIYVYKHVAYISNQLLMIDPKFKVNMIDADAPPFDAAERVLEISTASLESRVKVVQMA